MKIKVTERGLFGADGEIAVGTEFTVKEMPKTWAAKAIQIGASAPEGAELIVNPAADTDTTGKTKKRQGLEQQATELGLGFAPEATDLELAEAIKAARGK